MIGIVQMSKEYAMPEVELARGNSANYRDWYSLAKMIIPEGGVLATNQPGPK